MPNSRKRLGGIGALVLLTLAALVGRLAFVQLAEGRPLAAAALREVSRSVPLESLARGDILDRNGVSLTGTYQARRLVVFPDLIRDAGRDARALAPLLAVDPAALIRQFTGPPRVLPYPADGRVQRTVAGLADPGLMVANVTYRDGPGAMAVHLTGYVGAPENRAEAALVGPGQPDVVGLSGLERAFNRVLAGGPSPASRYAREYVDAAGRPVGFTSVDARDDDPRRCNLVLTIDARVQRTVETVMDGHVAKGAVVVLDAATGDVLAMASRPTFQPDRIAAYLGSPGDVFVNRALALYPPGSVFKVAVAAAALSEGLVTPESIFFDRGAAARPVPDWYKPGFGRIDFAHAFAESVNPFFARLGLELGPRRLIAYAEKLGLADASFTGYPRPEDPRQDWSLVAGPHALADASIGQGPVLVTPCQVAAMVEAVADGGVYVQPRLVEALVQDDGRVVQSFSRDPGRRVIGAAYDRELGNMMHLCTTAGTGRDAAVPGWGSAGKTGTAQAGPDGRKTDAWFAGFAPWPHPRFVAVVLVQGGTDGGKDAGTVFRLLMESLLNQGPQVGGTQP